MGSGHDFPHLRLPMWLGPFLRIALELYRELFGLRSLSHWLVAVLWIWGGGLITLLGSVIYYLTNEIDGLFDFEPAAGLWFLNLGRNLIYPMEAYYHALFLGAIYLAIRGNYSSSFIISTVLSLSHPFTGIELIGILLSWGMVEKIWIGNRLKADGSANSLQTTLSSSIGLSQNLNMPWLWIVGLVLLAIVHLSYYFIFLGSFPEHRSLQEQWTLDWTYEVQHFVPAYFLVGAFALWAIRNVDCARNTLSFPQNRLFLIWFLVAFALANHEFALKPAMQPLHFTRGYVWMPLFLIGGSSLIQLIAWFLKGSIGRWILVPLVMSIFLLDNILFLSSYHFRQITSASELYIHPVFADVVQFLNRPENRGAIVLSPNDRLNYWLLLHSPVKAWTSHEYNTPFQKDRRREAKEFFLEGKFILPWKDRILFAIIPKEANPEEQQLLFKLFGILKMQKVHSDAVYDIYRYSPENMDWNRLGDAS